MWLNFVLISSTIPLLPFNPPFFDPWYVPLFSSSTLISLKLKWFALLVALRVGKESRFPLFIHTLYLAGYNCIRCLKEPDASPRLDYSDVAVSGIRVIRV
jgi:hypothetical protein